MLFAHSLILVDSAASYRAMALTCCLVGTHVVLLKHIGDSTLQPEYGCPQPTIKLQWESYFAKAPRLA